MCYQDYAIPSRAPVGGGANPGKIGSRLWTNVRGRDLRTRMLFRKSSLVRVEFCTRSAWILKFKTELRPLVTVQSVTISDLIPMNTNQNRIIAFDVMICSSFKSHSPPSLITHATTEITHTLQNREHPFLSIFLHFLFGDTNTLVLSSPVGLQCL